MKKIFWATLEVLKIIIFKCTNLVIYIVWSWKTIMSLRKFYHLLMVTLIYNLLISTITGSEKAAHTISKQLGNNVSISKSRKKCRQGSHSAVFRKMIHWKKSREWNEYIKWAWKMGISVTLFSLFLLVRVLLLQRNQEATIIRISLGLVYVYIHIHTSSLRFLGGFISVQVFFLQTNEEAAIIRISLGLASVLVYASCFLFFTSNFCIQDSAESETIMVHLFLMFSFLFFSLSIKLLCFVTVFYIIIFKVKQFIGIMNGKVIFSLLATLSLLLLSLFQISNCRQYCKTILSTIIL